MGCSVHGGSGNRAGQRGKTVPRRAAEMRCGTRKRDAKQEATPERGEPGSNDRRPATETCSRTPAQPNSARLRAGGNAGPHFVSTPLRGRWGPCPKPIFAKDRRGARRQQELTESRGLRVAAACKDRQRVGDRRMRRCRKHSGDGDVAGGTGIGCVDDPRARFAAAHQQQGGADILRGDDLRLNRLPHTQPNECGPALFAGGHRRRIGHCQPPGTERRS